MVAKRALNVASAILALLIMALLVWEASDAAFSESTDETGQVSAVDLVLTDDGAVSAAFAPGQVVLGPTQSFSACVEVEYSTTPASWTPTLLPITVDPNLTSTANDLSDNLTLSIERVDSCADAQGTGSVVYSGPVEGAATSTSWTPVGSPETEGFWVEMALGDAPDSAEGLVADFELVWTVTTN